MVAALAATAALTRLAARAENRDDDTPDRRPPDGAFRGNPLPPELAGRPAPHFRPRRGSPPAASGH
jgi:hypothetical protein